MYICGGHSIIRTFTCLVKGIDFLLACDVVLIISKNLKSVWGLIRGKMVNGVHSCFKHDQRDFWQYNADKVLLHGLVFINKG